MKVSVAFFSYFKARFGAEMQVMHVCPLKGMPKL